ncbi:MAG TPA: MFS transporter [Myxococcaceae bacterium]|jgi:MFS family permease
MRETLFQISSATAYFAHSIFAYALIIYIQALTGTPAESGTLFIAMYAPMLLLGLYAGAVADRYSRKRILLFSQIAAGTFSVVAISIVALGRREWVVPIFLAVCPLYGGAIAFMPATRLAFVANLVADEALQRCTVLLKILNVASVALGPPLVGWVKTFTDWRQLFFIPIGLWITSTGLLFSLRVQRETPPAPDESRSWKDLKDGLKLIASTDLHRGLCILSGAIFLLISGPYQVLVPGFAQEVLHCTEAQRGVLMGSFGGGLLAGGILSAALNNVRARGVLLMGTLLASSSIFLGFSYQTSFPAAVALLATCGSLGGVFYSLVPTTLQVITPDRFRGRVLSVYYVLLLGGPALGAVAFGWMAPVLGLLPTLRIAAAGGVAVSAVAFFTLQPVLRYTTDQVAGAAQA